MDFSRAVVNLPSSSVEHCSRLKQSSDAIIDIFAVYAYTAALTPNARVWAGQPQKLPIPFGGSEPHLTRGSFGSQLPKRHLDGSAVLAS